MEIIREILLLDTEKVHRTSYATYGNPSSAIESMSEIRHVSIRSNEKSRNALRRSFKNMT